MKTFTDTEMLDFIIDNNASVFKAVHKCYIYYIPEDITSGDGESTPREAIQAEMNKENK